jgi:hypothetical protein
MARITRLAVAVCLTACARVAAQADPDPRVEVIGQVNLLLGRRGFE